MSRFILRFKGSAGGFPLAVSAVEELNGVCIVDRSPQMLLVEATAAAMEDLASKSEWSISPEKFTPLPDLRKRIG